MYSLGSFCEPEPADRVEAQVVVVDLLLDVGHPAEVDLGEDDIELGEPVEHAGEDELDHPVGRVEEAAVAGELGAVRGGHRLRQRDVDAERDAPLGEGGRTACRPPAATSSVPFG